MTRGGRQLFPVESEKNGDVRCVRNGEKRPPKKGEYYLSGAIPCGYQAPNDLRTPFEIVRLVRTRKATTIEIVEYL